VFPTRLSELKTLPDDLSGVLQFNNKIYTEYGEPVSFVNNTVKTDTDTFYNLTLISLAKELKMRGQTGGIVSLATGLPERWLDRQEAEFKKYLMKYPEVHYRYEGTVYHVYFEDCKVFSQGFAAAMTLPNIASLISRSVVLVDIGGGTVDIIPFSGKLDPTACKIDQRATLWLINDIQEAVEAEVYETLPESCIIDYMINGNRETEPQNEYEKIMQKHLTDYCDMIFTRLKEFRINTGLSNLIFIGGGACVIKNFGNYGSNVEFITDLKANAAGYETIYKRLVRV
jgi:plasmid segregation protein ParM